MALNVVSTDRLSTNVKTSNLATGLSSKVGESKNLIINGAMQVAQRATSSTTTGYGSVDRYKAEGSNTGQTLTHSQQSLSSSDTGPWEKGLRNYMRMALGSSGTANVNAWVGSQQRVEAQNVANSGWDYTSASSDITLSFWFRASTNQTFYSYIYSYDGTAQGYAFSFTATGNNTWTKVTKTIPGNSNITVNNDNGAGLQINFLPFIGTNSTNNKTLNTWAAHDGTNYCPDMASTWLTTGTPTFDVTGIQLEVGDTATEFEHRSYDDELRRCQRYYFRIHSTATDDVLTGCAWTPTQATAQGITFFPVVMRTRVTALEQSGTATDYQVSVGSGGSTCSSVPTFNHGGVNAAATTFTCTGTPWNISNTTRPSNKTTDGFLAWSAEL